MTCDFVRNTPNSTKHVDILNPLAFAALVLPEIAIRLWPLIPAETDSSCAFIRGTGIDVICIGREFNTTSIYNHSNRQRCNLSHVTSTVLVRENNFLLTVQVSVNQLAFVASNNIFLFSSVTLSIIAHTVDHCT